MLLHCRRHLVLTATCLAIIVATGTPCALAWDPDTSLANASASFLGESSDDRSGYSVANAGDVNGDGYDDILIGAPLDDDGGTSAGQAYLVLGTPSGWALETDLSNVDASFWGIDGSDAAGWSVAGAGDVNGDGFDDILIGAHTVGVQEGAVFVIFGKASGWAMDTDLSTADASFWGETSFDHAAESVAGAGDVNGDGYDDILVGAPENDVWGDSSGQAYLILGKATGWTTGVSLSSVDASFWGEAAYDSAGSSVAGAGDVNGDGFDDFLVGAYNNSEPGSWAGQAYLILGKAAGWAMDTSLSAADASFWGEGSSNSAGRSVASAGDVNGDGFDDFLVGAYNNSEPGSTAGQTYLVLGKASGWAMDSSLSAADASFWGEDSNDEAGRSVAGIGDVNGDGFDDLLIGASGDEDGGGSWAGQTYLILGKASGWAMDTSLSAADASFVGEAAGDYAGWSVTGAGDSNGDGFDDLLIGAYGNDVAGSMSGQTYLVLSDQTGSTDGAYTRLFAAGDTPATDFADADVTIDFSSASSSGSVTVTEHNNQNPPSSSGLNVVNRYWTITGSGLGTFTYDLTIQYADGEIAEASGNECALRLAYWDSTQWVAVPTTVDLQTNRVTASALDHFSDWALIGPAEPCNISWNNPSGGSWFEASNWSPAQVPVACDRVCIDLDGTYTVTVDATTAQVAYVDLGPSSGSVELSVGSGGDLLLAGALTVAQSGQVTLEGGSIGGTAITLDGSLDALADATVPGVTIGTTGTVTIQSDTSADVTLLVAGGIDNGGTITSEPGAQGLGARTLIGELTNSGTLQANYDLLIDGGSVAHENTSAGSISLPAGDITMDLTGPPGASSFTNNGAITVSAGQTFRCIGGTFEPGGGTLSGSLDLDQTDSGTGSLTVNSGAQLGLNSSSVETDIDNNGVIRIGGNTELLGALDNDDGTVRVAGTNATGVALLQLDGFTNRGTIEIASAATTAWDATVQITTGTLVNDTAGLIRSTGAGTGVRTIQGAVTNDGAIEAEDGDLMFEVSTVSRAPASFTNSGTMDIGGGRHLSLAGSLARDGSTFTQSGNIEIAVGGIMTVDTGVLTANPTSSTTAAGTLALVAVDATFESGATLGLAGTLQLAGGASGASSLDLVAGLTTSGTIELTNTDPGSTPRSAALSVGSTGLQLGPSGRLRALAGTGGGTRQLTGRLANAGSVQVLHPMRLDGGDLEHTSSGSLQLAADLELDLSGAGRAPSSFTNLGTVDIASGSTLLVTGATGRAPSSFTNLGTIDLADGSTLRCTAGQLTNGREVAGTGFLRGNGAINASGASFTNNGVIAPGFSPGALSVAGTISNGATGQLRMELGDRPTTLDYDRLLVSGTMNLAGTLQVSMLDEIEPDNGERYPLVTFAGSGGVITSDLPTLGGGRSWSLDSHGTGIDLEVECITGVRLAVLEANADQSPVTVGHQLDYQVRVGYMGIEPASDVVLRIRIPDDVLLLQSPAACTTVGNRLRCTIDTFQPGTTRTLQLAVEPTAAGLLTTRFNIRALECDLDPTDNLKTVLVQAVDADPCDADGDDDVTTADVDATVAYLWGDHSVAGNPDCSESNGVDAEDLCRLITLLDQ